ncbi:hypothetical protein B0A49_10970 [Cryomyces minteri]|uniref:Ubiquitin-like protease family profile domain-containing protein n=1 Tax=Cryomyces minteri TaxID=331657 RepID=A0A4U0WI66_9PEZI|nr:hypothetical protein B0A49_10970 [Cryomyces minteri]
MPPKKYATRGATRAAGQKRKTPTPTPESEEATNDGSQTWSSRKRVKTLEAQTEEENRLELRRLQDSIEKKLIEIGRAQWQYKKVEGVLKAKTNPADWLLPARYGAPVLVLPSLIPSPLARIADMRRDRQVEMRRRVASETYAVQRLYARVRRLRESERGSIYDKMETRLSHADDAYLAMANLGPYNRDEEDSPDPRGADVLSGLINGYHPLEDESEGAGGHKSRIGFEPYAGRRRNGEAVFEYFLAIDGYMEVRVNGQMVRPQQRPWPRYVAIGPLTGFTVVETDDAAMFFWRHLEDRHYVPAMQEPLVARRRFQDEYLWIAPRKDNQSSGKKDGSEDEDGTASGDKNNSGDKKGSEGRVGSDENEDSDDGLDSLFNDTSVTGPSANPPPPGPTGSGSGPVQLPTDLQRTFNTKMNELRSEPAAGTYEVRPNAYYDMDDLCLAIAAVTEAISERGKHTFALATAAIIESAGFGKVSAGTDQRVARPRQEWLLPWVHNSSTSAKYDQSNKDATAAGFTQNADHRGHIFLTIIKAVDNEKDYNASIMWMDSSPKYLESDRPIIFKEIEDRIINSGWFEVFGDSADPVFQQTRVQIPAAEQTNGWACGLHTILNAWAHALGLRINPGVQLGKDFYPEAVEVVNLALAGRMDSQTILNFMLLRSWVESSSIIPPERLFSKTKAMATRETLSDAIVVARNVQDMMDRGVISSPLPSPTTMMNKLQDWGVSPASPGSLVTKYVSLLEAFKASTDP